MTLEEKIAAKTAEIEHYIGVLDRYGRGRWYDQGRRHLADLNDELNVLRSQSIVGDAPHS